MRSPDPDRALAGGLRALAAGLFNPVVIAAALLPFQWIVVAQLGGFKIQLSYVGALLAFATAALIPRLLAAGWSFLTACGLWLLPYLAYLLILWLALKGSEVAGIAIRQVFFLMGLSGVGAWLMASRDLGRLLRLAGAAGMLLFLIGTEWMARGLGLSWLDAAERFFLAGDLEFIMYDFLRAIFNAQTGDAEQMVKASRKNAVAGALLFALCLFRIAGKPGVPDRTGQVLTVVIVIMLLMINTRSVLVAFGFGLVLVAFMNALRAQRLSLLGTIVAIIVMLAGVVGLLELFNSGSAFGDLLRERFAFSDDSSGARLDQFQWALEKSEGNLLWGSGYNVLDGLLVHNLFLGALMHVGIPGFLLIVFVYAVLVLHWLVFIFRIVNRRDFWKLPLRAEWVAVLPVVPLFRVWVAGDAGHPPLEAWLALAVFFALVALNAAALRRAPRRALPLRPLAQGMAPAP